MEPLEVNLFQPSDNPLNPALPWENQDGLTPVNRYGQGLLLDPLYKNTPEDSVLAQALLNAPVMLPTQPGSDIDPLTGVSADRPLTGNLQFSDDPILNTFTQEAIHRWVQSTGDEIAPDGITVQWADLTGDALGMTLGTNITIDRDAGGQSWFIDSTPSQDEEFQESAIARKLEANADSEAFGRIDLLTVLMHEIGHVWGYDHFTSSSSDLMSATLGISERRLPGSDSDYESLTNFDTPHFLQLNPFTYSDGFEDYSGDAGDEYDTLDFSAVTSDLIFTVNTDNSVAVTDGTKTVDVTNIEKLIGGEGINNNNTLIVTRDADIILTDEKLTIGSFSLVLENFTLAELTGGESDNLLDASGFSGNTILKGLGGNDTLKGGSGDDILEGGSGDDIYIFGDNWGNDTIIELADGGNDRLDFTGHTGTLKVLDDKQKITSSDGSILTQSTTVVEAIDFDFTSQLQEAVTDAFEALVDFSQRLEQQVNALSTNLPLLAAQSSSLADLLQLSDVFTQLHEEVNNIFEGGENTPTSYLEVVERLQTLPTLPPSIGSLTVTPDYRGATTDGQLELLLGLNFQSNLEETFGLNLGGNAEVIGIELGDIDLNVTAGLTVDLGLGFTTDTIPAAFLTEAELGFSASASATIGDSSLNLGILEATINGGSVSFDGGVTVALNDPNNDGRITLEELSDSAIADLVNVDITNSEFTADLPVEIDSGISLSGTPLTSATFSLGLPTGANLFSGKALEVSLIGPGDVDLLDFSNASPLDLVRMLSDIASTFASISGSVLAENIPFTNGVKLGDVLDFGTTFQEKVLNPLLKDGTVDPTLNGIQSLLTRLTDALELPSELELTANYNPTEQELTFKLDWTQIFTLKEPKPLSFGATLGDFAGVSTSSEFGLDALINGGFTFGLDLSANGEVLITPSVFQPDNMAEVEVELANPNSNTVQIIRVNNATFGTFKLTYDGQVTDDIEYNASASHIKEALEALSNVNNVSVSFMQIGNDRIYQVTFDDVDDDSTPDKIGALLTKPKVEVETSDDNIHTIRVNSGTAGTFRLTYDGQVTSDLNSYSSADDVKAALEELSKIGEDNVKVTLNQDENYVSYEVTFENVADIKENITVEDKYLSFNLRGAADGILSENASFSVKLFNDGIEEPLKTLNITVNRDKSKPNLDDLAQDIEDQINAQLPTDLHGAIKVNAGGGRISLFAPSTRVTTDPLEPAVLVNRRLEITADFDNSAFQELGLLSAPTRFDGRLNNNVALSLVVDGTAVNVELLESETTGNSSLDQLVTQLQTAIADALTDQGLAADAVEVFRINAKGNRIGLRSKGGEVSQFSLNVNETFSDALEGVINGAISDLGFEAGNGAIQRAKATEFFLEDVSLGGTITLSTPDGIEIDANLGFLGIQAIGDGSITGSAELALKNPLDGGDRLSIDLITAALRVLRDRQFLFNENNIGETLQEPGTDIFLFNENNIGGTVEEPGTGILEATVSGNVDFDLSIQPSSGIPGIDTSLSAEASLNIDIPNWLTSPPTANDIQFTFDGPDFNAVFDRFSNLSFSDIIEGLEAVVNFLQTLEGSGDAGDAIASALAFKLPLINRSISDLVNIASEYADLIDEIASNPTGSLQTLETLLRSKLGLPEGDILTFVPDDGVLRFDLDFGTSFSGSQPFNLDLPDELDFLNSLVGLNANGNLNIGADIGFNLALGLDLSNKSFFLFTGDAGTKLTASANANGENLDFSALLGPFTVSVLDGNAGLGGEIVISLENGSDRLDLLNFSGSTSSINLPSLSDISVDIEGEASASLPLFIGSVDSPIPIGSKNTLKFSLDNLEDFIKSDGNKDNFQIALPDFDLFSEPPGLLDLLSDPSVVVDGLDRLLLTLQEAVNGQILGVELPLIGDLLANNPLGNFIGDIRNELLQPLANQIRNNNLNLEGLIGVIQGTLFDVFHNDLNILQEKDGQAGITVDDILRSGFISAFNDPDDDDDNLSPENTNIQFDFTIGQTKTLKVDPIKLNLGIPAFGLDTELQPTITLEWSLDFGFGVDEKQGFYFVTDSLNELELAITVDFGSTIDKPANLEGRLGFLALTLVDGVDVDKNGTVDDDEFSQLFLKGTVDLADPNGDGRLTFAEMSGGSSISDIVKPTLTGGAQLLLEGTVDFGAIDSDLSSVLPSISTNLMLDWSVTAAPGQKLTFNAPSLALGDITLDLGSFISDFAGPILGKIKEVIDPLDWLIGPDGLLNIPVPLISDLAGTNITFKDLILELDPKRGPTIVAFLDAIENLLFLSGLVTEAAKEAEDNSLSLNFGSLVLSDPSGVFGSEGALELDPEELLNLGLPDLRSLKANSLKTFNLSNVTLPSAPSLPDADASTTKRFVSGVTQPGSLEFSLFKPETIFKLLMGQPDITLFTYELPKFGAEFYYRQEFPIFGPLVAFFGGGVSAGIDLGFGYDTRGLDNFLASDNPLTLLNGFFLRDVDSDGVDIPEAFVNIKIAAGAGISLGFAKAGVEGGIEANILFNFADLDGDGKIRFDELTANMEANNNNPLAVFDVEGSIEFFLNAFLEINLLFTKIKKNFEFARLTLFEFDIPFERPGNLATQSGDTLTLSIGPNAANRLQGNIVDGDETIYVKSAENGDILVWSDQFKRDVAEAQVFSGVNKIIADGGLGNDVIDLSGVTRTDITTEIKGGDGDDIIKGSHGNDIIDGGAGNDKIYGTAGNNIIRGGAGNDIIHGGTGDDTIYGDAGDDTIYGNAGNNTLDGGTGNNEFTGGTGDDTYVFANAGALNTVLGVSAGDDILDFSNETQNLTFILKNGEIVVGRGKDANGNFESQVIVDVGEITQILGGRGADTFHVYETGAAGILLDGGQGNDQYNFYVGSTTLNATVEDNGNPWNSGDVIEVRGTNNADTITVTDTNISFGSGQTVNYVAPAADANVLQLKIKSFDGDDLIEIASTAETVPVRVFTGSGDDTVIVGSEGSLNNIRGLLRPGLGLDVGPLVLVGEGGNNTVILDDSSNISNNIGNLTAFVENRLGNPEVEVGVISGLGMSLNQLLGNALDTKVEMDGRVEFEGFGIVKLKLGAGDDLLTVGSDAILPDLPQLRQESILNFTHTIQGMTLISSGDGNDQVQVIATNSTDRNFLNVVNATTITPGNAATNEVQQVTVTTDVGYFTLKYDFEETAPLAFNATAAEVQAALVSLLQIGQNSLGEDNVTVTQSVNGEYTITFVNDLGRKDVANLVAQFTPLYIDAGGDKDTIRLQAINQDTFVNGGAGDDVILANVDALTGVPLTSNGINAIVTLDGGNDSDTYEVNLIGDLTNSLINVFDRGTTGTDELTVNGTEEADIFLLRAAAAQNGLAFIALLNADDNVERINYNTNLESIVINSLGGDDEFYIDDTRAAMTINAGDGDDFFQIGQLYNSRRTPDLAGVAPEDVFATIETTQGFLSNGISNDMTINGGKGDDTFIVFHNKAVLTLNGEDGDDSFLLQAFALAGSQENLRQRMDVSGGAGNDLIQYAVNAPVNIDGGDGFDTVIVIGTEFNDDFIITDQGVFGAGLNANFVNVESLEIDGGAGDDRFYILGTGANFSTTIVGGLGSDTFIVNGPTPANGVISNDLKGHSGIITHNVVSSDADSFFNGLSVEGISVNVADNDEPAIVINQSNGFSSVVDGEIDTYTVVLSRPPRDHKTVTVTALPPAGLVFVDQFDNELRNANTKKPIGVELDFTSANWQVAQTVRFKADSEVATDNLTADIQHKVSADDALSGTVTNASNLVAGGGATLTDDNSPFPVASSNLPEGLRGAYVTIIDAANREAVGQTRLILSNTANTLTLNKAWNVAPVGAQYEILRYGGLVLPTVQVALDASAPVPNPASNSIGVQVIQSGASTDVVEGGAGDSYQVVLTTQPVAGESVTVNVVSEPTRTSRTGGIQSFTQQLLLSNDNNSFGLTTSLTFTDANWNTPQTVYVQALDDNRVDGGDTKVFAPTLAQASSIQGPLTIIGGEGSDRTGLLEREPMMLPGETNSRLSLGEVLSATESFQLVPATVTIAANDPDLLNFLGVANASEIDLAEFQQLSIAITDGPGKNKTRVITDAARDGAGNLVLTLQRTWFSPFNEDASVPTNGSSYTLITTNPNLLVNEADETDLLIINDTDNINSDNASANAVLTSDQLTGLGMNPAGIQYTALENVVVNLGSGNNTVDITSTHTGTTTVNTGAGDDQINIESIAGHTFVNAGAGSDTINVRNTSQTLEDLQGLLTVSGDVPQATMVNLAQGSPAGNAIASVNAIQQLTVDATGGTFTLSLNDVITSNLAANITASGLQAALEALPTIGAGNVVVTKAGSIYRVEFLNALGGQSLPLLRVNDSGLSNGLGSQDVLNIDDSGYTNPTVGVLTESTLTGLSTPQVNEIQTLVLDATGGTFQLSFNGATTGNLDYDITAETLQAALQGLGSIGTGNVVVTRNDDVYVIRFQGTLTNTDVAQLLVVNDDLSRTYEIADGALATDAGTATVFTRVNGATTPATNDLQSLTVNATNGTFTLSILDVTTDAIAYDASAEEVRNALQIAVSNTLPEQFKSDITVDKYGNTYLINFQGKLRQVNSGPGVDFLQANTNNLTGTVAISTRMDGINYYGFEQVNLHLGQNNNILNIQGTTAGSNGFAEAGGVAVTNVKSQDGNDQVYISSNADLDFNSATLNFDFLTGDLDAVNGALNLDLGGGRQRLMISDEAATVGDENIVITDVLPTLLNGLATTADIWVTGLSGQRDLYPAGGISYKVAANGNFFDGITYWTGSGDDTVYIDGTHKRSGERTTTLLNTGLGNDNITINLDLIEDDFLAVNASGGEASANPNLVNPATVRDDDIINASQSTLPLVIFGGFGDDTITGGQNNDIIFGDFGRVYYEDATGDLVAVHGFGGRGDRISSQNLLPSRIFSTNPSIGGNDTIFGGDGNDLIFGGTGNDTIYGEDGNDLIFGDNGLVAGDVDLNLLPLSMLDKPFTFTSIFTTNTDEDGNSLGGDDIIYGGAGDDILIGGQGNDTIYGEDGDDDIIGGHNVAGGHDGDDILDGGAGHDVIAGDNASILRRGDSLSTRIRTLSGPVIYDSEGNPQVTSERQLNPTGVEERDIIIFDHGDDADPLTYGNDYIAGGAGNDVIFGQMGDDIIQGDGSVSLNVSATSPSVEDFAGVGTDGDDYIEGGGGDDIIFGNLGQDEIIGGSSSLYGLTTWEQRPDGADLIFGGAGTRIGRNDPGDTSADGHARDADYILGDNGNIYRLVDSNGEFLTFNYDNYGTLKIIPRAFELLDYTPGTGSPTDRGGDDVIYGEAGNDTLHGMTGNDIIFGDGQDDDIYGGTGHDRLYGGTGEDGILGDDGKIFTSRNGMTEPLYGLNTPNLETYISIPGQFTGAWVYITGRLLKTAQLEAWESGGNDIIYGGLGDDFLHGGAGDDGISGAEAQAAFYNRDPITNTNPLGYDPVTRKFAAYDANNPMKKIDNFFLNFDAVDENGNKINDGKDNIFGGLGNDWLVGGTENDRLFGGLGDDLLNADDNLDTNGGLNNQPDDPEFADADFAFGGGGLDVLIGNTGGDRLFDWNGEFNSYFVPFSPFGDPTVVRSPSPQIEQFLLDLGKASGADQNLTEPYGELGLVTSQDALWQEQQGAPRDPQAGNTNARRDTQGGPEDDRNTAIPSTGGNSGNTGNTVNSGNGGNSSNSNGRRGS